MIRDLVGGSPSEKIRYDPKISTDYKGFEVKDPKSPLSQMRVVEHEEDDYDLGSP